MSSPSHFAGRPHLVLCAGIPRSGSTWMYNATRFLLEAEYSVPVYGSWISDYDFSHGADCHVVKLHEADDEFAVRAQTILTSHRDIRDIGASAWLRGWVGNEQQTLEFVEKAVSYHTYWADLAALDLSYETIKETPLLAIRNIADCLGCASGIDSDAVLARINALSMPKTGGNDPVTLLWPSHQMHGGIGYFKELLQPAVIERIEKVFKKWLQDKGFAI